MRHSLIIQYPKLSLAQYIKSLGWKVSKNHHVYKTCPVCNVEYCVRCETCNCEA